jgi:hypothetical protein
VTTTVNGATQASALHSLGTRSTTRPSPLPSVLAYLTADGKGCSSSRLLPLQPVLPL